MKFIIILACLVLYVAHSEAQWSTCRGIPNRPICVGRRDEGFVSRPICARNANREMWWYDNLSRTCQRLSYRGCGGNSNRYCTLSDCLRRCRPF
ncbi:uncharacterized protein Dvir_GJ12906 [Drosophila virilis]|uniref:BPTI/Kunitz inhibitor domain-containing protein n=2 Tax=Drosophila virilis TaxID=7244 RepID=B4LCU1_DROVI|nr:kunitz-type serine protease inhibitor homolog alpha-dendrotoxin [Drosophila virilis]EDW68802.1 uncharacterized protein Dvir_GJ12906 [Drosophila virilis]